MTTTSPLMMTTSPLMTTTPTKIKCGDTNKDLEGCARKIEEVITQIHKKKVMDQILPVWITFSIICFLILGYFFYKYIDEKKNAVNKRDRISQGEVFVNFILIFGIFVAPSLGWWIQFHENNLGVKIDNEKNLDDYVRELEELKKDLKNTNINYNHNAKDAHTISASVGVGLISGIFGFLYLLWLIIKFVMEKSR